VVLLKIIHPMRAHLAYLQYVLKHKRYVFLACWRLGIPWLGLIHDWSKFLPSEWFPYVQAFYNPDGSKKDAGFRAAGLYPKYALCHHLNSNKHHWRYWVLPDGEILPMPDKYRREMLADWIGAGLANNQPNFGDWYLKHKDEMKLHPDTRQWIEEQLGLNETTTFEIRLAGQVSLAERVAGDVLADFAGEARSLGEKFGLRIEYPAVIYLEQDGIPDCG
jgi:hypothetical protein